MKLGFVSLFLALAALLLAACTASGSQGPSTTPTSGSELATTTPILLTPESITALDELRPVRLKIYAEPDELALLNGYIWTKTADGHVVQIDPATNTVIANIKADTTSDLYHYCEGLGTDGENIWACSARGEHDTGSIDVVRIDPALKEVIQTIPIDKIFDQLELPFSAGRIWVLTGNGDKLVGIDVATNEPGKAIDLGVRCFQLAAVGDSLFATCRLDDVILQIDPESGEITRRIDSKGPRSVDGDEDTLWVLQGNSLLRLDAESLSPEAEWQIGGDADIQVTEDAIWVRRKDGFLYRIDPASNKIVEQIQPAYDLSMGSLLVTADDIWTTAYDDNLLLHISRQD